MDEANDTSVVAADTQGDTNTAPDTQADTQKEETKTDYRPKLSDEEQLAILEGRTQRLRTKLGKNQEPAKQSSSPDDLSEMAYLAARSITADDEVDLARSTAKKWGLSLPALIGDADWQDKLAKHRTQKANEAATTGIKGGAGSKSASQTPEFYIARGAPPTRDEVPDRKERVKIMRTMMDSAKNGKKFYNDL